MWKKWGEKHSDCVFGFLKHVLHNKVMAWAQGNNGDRRTKKKNYIHTQVAVGSRKAINGASVYSVLSSFSFFFTLGLGGKMALFSRLQYSFPWYCCLWLVGRCVLFWYNCICQPWCDLSRSSQLSELPFKHTSIWIAHVSPTNIHTKNTAASGTCSLWTI